MNYPIVYDKSATEFNSLGLAVLEKANNVKVREVINGEFTLSFILPPNSPKWQFIKDDNIVKVYNSSQKKDQLFRIRTTDIQRDQSGKITSNVQCEHVYYDALDCKHIPAISMIGVTPRAILEEAFSGTPFTIGTVEITTLTDIEMDKVSPADVASKVIELVGGELVKDNWTLHLVNKRGSYKGVQFRVGKNIQTIKMTTDSKDVKTRIFAYGKDDMPLDNSTGYIDSPLIGLYGRPKIGYMDFKDIEDPDELMAEALKVWSTSEQDGVDKPKVTITASVVELKKLKEYGDFEAFGIGDGVKCIDEDLGINSVQRIVQYDEYPYEAIKSSVSLANYSVKDYKANSYAGMMSGLLSSQSTLNKVTTSTGELNPGWFENIKTKLKTLFNGQINKCVVHSQGDIWVDNPDNPTMAMAIIAGGFAIADSKDTSGNWEWKTFGTASDGFVADFIKAGTLQGITINVSTDAKIGNNLQLGDNEQVSDHKTISFYKLPGSACEITALKAGDNYSMFITADTIDIEGGQILKLNATSVVPKGTWNCANAFYSNLKDNTGQFYATEYYVDNTVDDMINDAMADHIAHFHSGT